MGRAKINGERNNQYKYRLLIFPGIAGLWPLMLTKLFTQKEPPVS